MKKKDLIFIAVLMTVALLGWGGMTIARRGSRVVPPGSTSKGLGQEQETDENESVEQVTQTAGGDAGPTPAASNTGTDKNAEPAVPEPGNGENPEPAASNTGIDETAEPAASEPGNGENPEPSPTDTGNDETGEEHAAENGGKDLSKYGSIVISVNGEYYGDYSLGEDQVIEINDTNVVEIKDGAAKMIHAECPDQLCTYMGPVTGAYDLIVCLPNAVIIEGYAPAGSQDTLDIDGIS